MRFARRALPVVPFLIVCVVPGPAAAQHEPPRTFGAPLWFEPMPVAGQYHARAAGGVAYSIEAGRFSASAGADQVTVAVVGAAPAAVVDAGDRAPGISNYYFGRDPAFWRTAVPHFGRLVAREVHRGVDIVWRSAGRDLELDLVARPGADLAALRLRVEGAAARGMRLLADGAVSLPLAGGELRLQPPCVWQERLAARTPVASRYRLRGDEIEFDLGAHDPQLELVIDPVVTFATLLGGSGNELGIACAIDNQGNMVVTGSTTSTNFPLLNPLFGTIAGVQTFVTKFDAQGSLVFSTYFGGTGLQSSTPIDIGCDPQGRVVLGGNTNSGTLPITPGVVQPLIGASTAWFFTTLLPSGALAWCTYYNGGGTMKALHVLDVIGGSVIGVGNGYLPLMSNAYSAVGDIGVAGIFGGNVLWVSTQCGFSGMPTAIHMTQNGHICITGTTVGTGLPTTVQSFQSGPVGWIDGFVFVFFGTTNSLVFCSYFGGTNADIPRRIWAVSGPGTVHCTIAGETSSTDLPVLGAVQPLLAGSNDAFIARLNGNATGLDFSTYFGGTIVETINGLAVDAAGNTFFAGNTNSLNLPSLNSLRTPVVGVNQDAFAAKLSPSGGQLVWSTTIGGRNADQLNDLAVGPGNAIVVAGTSGLPFPVTPNALPSPPINDAFLVRLADETFESYGAPTAGYQGSKPTLAGGGSRSIGSTALFNIHDGRSQSFGLLGIGSGRTQIPLLNGFLWTVPVATLAVQLGGLTSGVFLEAGGGCLHLSVPIPATPSLVNAVTNWQAAFLDAGAAGGISLTNGVEMIIQ
jgi:hypothetical protein